MCTQYSYSQLTVQVSTESSHFDAGQYAALPGQRLEDQNLPS